MSERAGPNGLRGRVGLIVVGAVIISALVALLVEPQHVGGMMGPGMMRPPQDMGVETDIRMFLSTYNVILLLALTWSYLVVYRDLPNRFTGSLLLFAVALLLYAMASNPAIHVLFGFRGGPELGPFAFLPDLFAAFAVTVLLYQSFQ
ncbi:hypothetical protein RH831_00750 [Halodesulfurarchaeum sp. HSR-GB]|uniref:hypothetical protein n=1 Tax=Halodesulfurarchaeum sp. HSR-GB TaxID=3074077 RepID=UPI0028645B5D|nr:hypothetical protein [Halodesulfurarchaeum sp. HSR-GB]MDR5655710.1 hypothetical protein [Halodesulfurarchaeum sp. HSR-GB]